ncbi:hypothetical protein VFMJ11_1726 [Aliivibrio fischeri MJ11]|uniref:Protein CopB n=1 Tax=Aliivibrio fischeri (strain MJ11) TaxID=388396 RepID=B5FF45_ALIFM|nr:RepB family protein [Aliivibrio fischeri]ACH66982.1 hypothetical protein VFMJ11_1726 [Aliivibrio fischeri MJ11]
MLKDIRFIRSVKLILQVRNPNLNKREVLDRLSKVLHGLSSSDKKKMAKISCRYPIILQHLEPSTRKEILNSADGQFSKLGIEYNLFSLVEYFRQNYAVFDGFSSLKHELECSIAAGENKESLVLLDKFDQKFGKNLWSLDARLSLMSRYCSPQELADVIENSFSSESEKQVLSILFKKYTSTSIEAFLKNGFKDVMNEYRQNNGHAFIDLVSSFTLPPFHDDERNIDQIVFGCELLGNLDKYLVLKKAMLEYFYKDYKSQNHDIYLDFIYQIAEVCDDIFWKRLITHIEQKYELKTNSDKKEIIENYSNGDYRNSIDKCNELINKKVNDLSLLDIKAKSILHFYTKDVLDNVDDLEDIEKVSSDFEKLLITHFIFLYLDSATYNANIEVVENLSFKFNHLDLFKSLIPYCYVSYPCINRNKIKSSTYELYLSGFDITEKLYSYLKPNTGLIVNSVGDEYLKNLSESRRIRYEIQKSLDFDNINHIEVYSKIAELENFEDITIPEMESLKTSFYLKTKKYNELYTLISKSCIEKSSNCILYPLKHMVNILNEDFSYRSNLSSVICSYIYSLSNENQRELTSEVLEDYLSSRNVEKPSELLEGLQSLSEEEFYFFEKVCNTDLMSDLLCFTSSKELLLERIKIIQFLTSTSKVKNYRLLKEEKKIFSDLLSHNLASKHEKNKIYIDSEGIIKSQLKEYKFILENILVLSSLQDECIDLFYDEDEGISDEDRRENRKVFVFEQLYTKIIENYINNSNHGLVRSLSSEIRHGVLPNQIRSVLEALNLVTIVGVDGEYTKNQYWWDYNTQLANSDFVSYIDDCLKLFSKNIDALISEINSWPKVSINSEHNDSVFTFNTDIDSIKKFRMHIEPFIMNTIISGNDELPEDTVISILNECENYLWIEIEENFTKMKMRLNEKAKPKFLQYFKELKESVNKTNVNLAKLNSDIDSASLHVNEEINKIEKWFRRPDVDIDGEITLYNTILSSIECINNIHTPKKIDIDLSGLYQSQCASRISMRIALGLVRALVSIYQNCLKHGKQSSNTPIKIYNEVVEYERVILVISNEITNEKYEYVMESDYINKVNGFSLSAENEKLVNEGETGLYKIFRNIIDSSNNSKFSIDVDELHFYQKVLI